MSESKYSWAVRLTGVTDFASLQAAILQRYPQARVRPLESEQGRVGVILPQESWHMTDESFFAGLYKQELYASWVQTRVEEER